MSIADSIIRLQNIKADLKSAIESKGVTVSVSDKLDDYPALIESISGGSGGSTAPKKQINFVDYDGTILHSYTIEEWDDVTELPSNPSHTGLIAQGWNWTKTQINTQIGRAFTGDIWVGQMYITDDGKTRIYIHLEEGRLHPYLGIGLNGTAVINWGDGSGTTTVTGSSLTTVTTANHEYVSEGDYIITLDVSNGSFQFFGTNSLAYILCKSDNSNSYTSRVYANCVNKIEIGSNAIIGTYAFYNCYSLKSITIPSSMTSIESNAFNYCYSIANITIPSNVTNIGAYAFCNCYSLENITMPSGVSSIGTYAFGYCYSLESITIPSRVTSIESNVFYNCYSLNSITIPLGVVSIESNAFGYCYSLNNITIPSSVTNIGSYAFNYCYSIANITIPSNVTNIGAYAFNYCCSLKSITIPSSMTSIESNVFNHCESLTNITIPSSVTNIGSYAFNYCYSIANITIPSSVTSIGNYAFMGCYGVAEYHFLSTTPPTLGNTMTFYNIQSDCVIYVPSGSLETYKTATNWSSYASYMQGE